MKASETYFSNTDCKYFPCHTPADREDFNCLFCYCPLYGMESCPGTPKVVAGKDGEMIRDCSDCIYPHKAEHFRMIVELLGAPLVSK